MLIFATEMNGSNTITSLQNTQSRAFEWSLYLIVFTLPLIRPHWNSKLIIALVILWLILIRPKKIWIEIVNQPITWLFSSIFFASLIGLLHTENIGYGLKYIETQLPILVFPVILISSRVYLKEKVVDRIFYSLILSIISILIGYCIIISKTVYSGQFLLEQLLQQRLTDYPPIMNQTIIPIHPSFLSMYISISVVFILDQYLKKRKYVAITVILLLTFICFQIWLNSRTGIISFLIVLLVYLLFQFKAKARIYGVISFIVIIVMIFSIPFTHERLINAPLRAIRSGLQVNATDQQTWPISFRIQIIDCSIELLDQFKWVYGYGTGDFRDNMRTCYDSKNYTWLMARDLDEHCEYFAQLHRLGVLGLLILIAVFIYPMQIAYQTKNYLYLSLLILMTISALTENILSSQKAVVFYAIFNAVLFTKSINNNSSKIN